MTFPDNMLTALAKARELVAFTGAGMSAESGVPTFRGNNGLWAKFKPEELANLNAFLRNPEMVWEWYAARKKVIADVQPNRGHYALAEMETLFPTFAVVTQNIDNLHRRSGSRKVFELHGNIERNYCMRCGQRFTNEEVLTGRAVPRCSCGGLIRPDVVWFGEMLPEDEWNGAERACQRADVLLSIGTSGVVYPAAALPMEAKRNGAFIIEINPEPTPLSEVADVFLRGTSGEILPAMLQQLKQFSHSHSPTRG
jgi:NAD-dependent deacetylase